MPLTTKPVRFIDAGVLVKVRCIFLRFTFRCTVEILERRPRPHVRDGDAELETRISRLSPPMLRQV